MRTLLIVVVFVCCVDTATGYCYAEEVHEDQCTTRDGVTIPAGSELHFPDKCEKCTCSSTPGKTSLFLSCCGYGIHAGVYAPPPGCKVIAGDDGCSVKIVQITDESQPCSH
ncbi:uncharacterized protein LOC123555319 [Mercenaria mercenaria]|uniref:uncharacterized protein LOC123555319 n=1 Tax=Mercenaria mercenaria TaxID=6596 RepID=UPI001E1D5837|nr:uncharacterized protein LOC123555319 [Mercenaria mercenaria]